MSKETLNGSIENNLLGILEYNDLINNFTSIEKYSLPIFNSHFGKINFLRRPNDGIYFSLTLQLYPCTDS